MERARPAAPGEKIAVALCAVGAEKIAAQELRKLGLEVAESGFGRVRFRSGLGGLYRALMAMRTADRILLEAAGFPARDFDGLFEGTRAVPWEDYLGRDMGLVVDKVRSSRSVLKAETSIQAVVHKAAAERLCGVRGIRRLPDDGKKAELRVYVEKDRVSLLLDLSGEPLFKRGYRPEGGTAPLRETTAAALLLLALWRRKFPLYDPFCGSGTILAEAALYAWDAAPGLGRRFALGDLLIADSALEESIRAELRGRVNFDRTIRIAGSDQDPRAVSLAVSNLRRARDLALGGEAGRPGGPELPELPELRVLPMEEARSPFGGMVRDAATVPAPVSVPVPGGETGGFIITNPPYGKRLGEPGEAEACYAGMSRLRRGFPGWKLGVITNHPGFESFFGRGADSCKEISNGAARSYFFQYQRL
ncbi:MAG: class I SAM-dependent RNA methyltransferase [Treponema sp.]|nr:class I SAM-dependent RNA methyltransferase [Treponema sp.]